MPGEPYYFIDIEDQDAWYWIIPGETYLVTFGDADYVCVGVDDPNYPYLGNKHIHAEEVPNTGEPFFIMGGYAYIQETLMVTVSVKKVSIKYLDETFIPNSIARKRDIPQIPVTSVNGQTGDVVIDIPAPAEPNVETWTFELENGTTVTKQVMLA